MKGRKRRKSGDYRQPIHLSLRTGSFERELGKREKKERGGEGKERENEQAHGYIHLIPKAWSEHGVEALWTGEKNIILSFVLSTMPRLHARSRLLE